MDWSVKDSRQHGAIHRIYSTHYYDRVSGAKLEVLSIPAFVLRLVPPEIAGDTTWTSRSIQDVLEMASELLGADGQLFQIVDEGARFEKPASSRRPLHRSPLLPLEGMDTGPSGCQNRWPSI